MISLVLREDGLLVNKMGKKEKLLSVKVHQLSEIAAVLIMSKNKIKEENLK
jgi:hypothetical protein